MNKICRVKLNFPSDTAKDLMDCFVGFYNRYPNAKNIGLQDFSVMGHYIEISWEEEKTDEN